MESIAASQASETQPIYRRWVGVLLSFLIPGSGIYLSGNKSAGLRWFCGLMALGLANEVLTPLPAIPGILAFLVTALSGLALAGWMLVRSFRPVPKMRVASWLLFVALACALGGMEWTIANQFIRAFRHPTGSMSPTLTPGDRSFACFCAYWFAQPRRGDIVVFKTGAVKSLPNGQVWDKRIAALPGERVQIQKGRLVIDGRVLAEPAILAGDNFKPVLGGLLGQGTNFLVVPSDCYFVVGDNATNSLDSRDFGPIPRRSILGKVTKIYWPPSRIGDVQ